MADTTSSNAATEATAPKMKGPPHRRQRLRLRPGSGSQWSSVNRSMLMMPPRARVPAECFGLGRTRRLHYWGPGVTAEPQDEGSGGPPTTGVGGPNLQVRRASVDVLPQQAG